MNKRPIGVFDSGFGGLTVLKEIIKELPAYDYIYLGDNARAPYGTRSFDTVYRYTLQCVNWFFSQGCPLVILACNTASAKALRSIQQNDLPALGKEKRVLGVIRPTSEIIGGLSPSKHVGIFGTTGTVVSDSYPIEIKKFSPEVKVTQEACPMWVPLIENNELDTEGADFFIERHVHQLLAKDPEIDTILLACTHYPLIVNKIRENTGKEVSIIEQGEIVAKSLADYLIRHKELAASISRDSKRTFYTTGDIIDFNKQASVFYGGEIQAKHIDLI